MTSNRRKLILYLLVWLTFGEAKALVSSKIPIETGVIPKKRIYHNNRSNISTYQIEGFTEFEVKSAEASLSKLNSNIDKIKTLLKLSDWYELSYNNPKTLDKAVIYANDALSLSQSLHSIIYAGKCYLQLSMLYELKNNNEMIEICARKAIKLLSKTDDTNDLGEAWVMIWSAKMRTNAPLHDRFVPIINAAGLFKASGNDKRTGDCYREISELYFSNSDFHNSLNALNKAISYYKAANLDVKNIYPIASRLNILYETDKKNKDFIRLKNESLIQQGKLKNEALLRNSMIIFLVLLLIILALLYKSYVFKKKTNNALKAKQDEINKKNQALQNLVTEKEWLLKEIHHRVKNNLHMVVGLLASQSEFLKNEEAVQAISDSQNRIQTMSLIHQKLYQSENLSIIDMPSYIFELTEYLKDSYEIRNTIRFVLDIDSFNLPLSHSIPIGLIFNEAVTNAIKYAFPDQKKGIINILLKTDDNNKYRLIIHDNGIGLPPDFDPYNNPSLGIKLMHGLSADIDGQFLITNSNGTKITLEFIFNENNSH
ncbi:sensor histidine kinase [Flavobacterium panacagri]|uniref:sensor histidine kinase n=1 Tax=Flavobacterium panacagri TaxID=3034146 RepID=UPI0025A6015B|nr:sensor histidine kinase [Flavobacterium panacagri]